MERLTKRDEFGNADIIGVDSADLQLNLEYDEFNLVTKAMNRLASYEDTGLTPEQLKNLKTGVIPAHWGELFKAECDGRLVVLPCKVGDTVWMLNHHYRAVDGIVESIHQNYVAGCAGRWVVTVYFPEFYGSLESGIDPDFAAAKKYLHFDDFGKTIFLTLEAAMAALAERERGSDNA